MLYVVFGIVLLGLGIVSLIFPQGVWEVLESRKSRGSDGPSYFFEIETRIVGAIYCVLGLVSITLPLWS